ncbi:MAG: TonB-dependent receptor, partial [Ignavibacteria bacterium]
MNRIKYIIALITLSVTFTFAQNQGKITGKIVDASTKQPLIGVNVIVEGLGVGAATDENGNFIINGLEPGAYTIKASYIGFEPIVKTDVMVMTSKPTNILFELKEQVLNLEGVTVTSGYYEQDKTETVSVTSFSYEELRRSPGGFEDVVRALSIIPGVAKQSAGRNDLIVRGGAPSENLYLLDGFVVPNINHFATQGATGGTNSYVDLDFVNKSTFSTGGFSVKYGDKLSSVLGVELRDPREDRIGGKALISATQFGINMEGPISQNDNFLFSLRRSYLDFIFNAVGFSFVPQYWDMMFKYNHNYDNNDKLSFLFVGAKDDVNFNYDDKESFVKNSRILANSQRQYTAGISYRHLFDKGFIDFRFGRNYVDYDNFQKDSLLNPIFVNKSIEAVNNFSTDLILKTGKKSELNLGVNYYFIESNNEILFPSQFVTSFGETLPMTNYKADRNFNKAGIYGLYSFPLLSNVQINAGVRADYFGAIENKFSFSPRLSARWAVSGITSVNLSMGIYKQAPSYIWLAYPGNNKLDNIQVEQYILGVDHLFSEHTKFKAEIFYKNYSNYPASLTRNYLVLANAGAGFGGAEENYSSFGLEPLVSGGTGESKGIEISLQKKSSDIPLYGLISFTYSQTNFTALDGIERSGQFDQRVILNISG